MFGLGTQELLVVFVIGGLLFGAKKLPELGKGLGEAIRGFKKSVSETEELASVKESHEKTTKSVEGGSSEKSV
jgi:sec-independent protein translocase protein TatA